MPTSSFNQGTMQKAQKDLIKEMNILVECAEDDPNCREYDVDSKGEVLIK